MREIKFRAWDKKENKMFQVFSITLNEDGTLRYVFYWDRYPMLKDKDVELMQWTGLQDTNGQDIYEGDIISEDPSVWNGHFYYFIVNMRDGCWEAKSTIPLDKNARGCLLFTIKNPKVEGNKFENPELIEEE